MSFCCFLLLCCLLGPASAWNQPSACFARRSSCSEVVQRLENKLSDIQQTLASSFNRLIDVLNQTQIFETVTTQGTNTATPTAELATTVVPNTEPETTVVPNTEPATTVTQTNEPTTTVIPTTESTATTILTTEMTNQSLESCGGPGWRRVAYINMTDPNQTCPEGLRLTTYSIRTCGRTDTSFQTYSSVIYPVNGSEYSQVCGRITAYRYGSWHLAFYGVGLNNQDIDGTYVDGVSLTHGSPRQHIWTFASGQYNTSDASSGGNLYCPCDPGNRLGPPPYVGNDYFCESAATIDNYRTDYTFYPDNALWDGLGCEGTVNQCCVYNNPPWFYKTLPQPTTDDIEFRLSINYYFYYGDIAVELMELYIR